MLSYPELLKRALTGLLYNENLTIPEPWEPDAAHYGEWIMPEEGVVARILKPRDFSVGSEAELRRQEGRDWPLFAQTMTGMARLNALHGILYDVILRGIPGDLMECGVWRGGTGIFMRSMLDHWEAYEERHVILADSFEGMPEPDPRYPRDANAPDHTFDRMRVSLDQVIDNFARYGYKLGQPHKIHFLKGWFKDTLPGWTKPLAILRIDGDLYGSTMDCLVNLYDHVTPGGFVIVDDFALDKCKDAVLDFRRDRNITDEIFQIDWTGIYWRKEG